MNTFSVQSINILWSVASFGALLIVLAFGGTLVGKAWRGSLDLSGLISEPGGDSPSGTGKTSLSRFQALIFTFVVAVSLVAVIANAKSLADPGTMINSQLLSLLGGSAGTYLLSKYIGNPTGQSRSQGGQAPDPNALAESRAVKHQKASLPASEAPTPTVAYLASLAAGIQGGVPLVVGSDAGAVMAAYRDSQLLQNDRGANGGAMAQHVSGADEFGLWLPVAIGVGAQQLMITMDVATGLDPTLKGQLRLRQPERSATKTIDFTGVATIKLAAQSLTVAEVRLSASTAQLVKLNITLS